MLVNLSLGKQSPYILGDRQGGCYFIVQRGAPWIRCLPEDIQKRSFNLCQATKGQDGRTGEIGKITRFEPRACVEQFFFLDLPAALPLPHTDHELARPFSSTQSLTYVWPATLQNVA